MNYGSVVIGAHTGEFLKEKLASYINKKNILVEPVFYNLEQLKKNFSSFKDTQYLDCAISNADEVKSFYYIKQESVSKLGKHWASGIGSFSKDHILSHKTKRFQVSNETFQKRFSIKSIEFLHIDAEGAEFNIMNDINFATIFIKKIFFEKKHFDGPFLADKKLDRIKKILKKNSYILSDVDSENILAEKKIA
jgi:FkbM family methyltransferase